VWLTMSPEPLLSTAHRNPPIGGDTVSYLLRDDGHGSPSDDHQVCGDWEKATPILGRLCIDASNPNTSTDASQRAGDGGVMDLDRRPDRGTSQEVDV
jgi:hypothetical protein